MNKIVQKTLNYLEKFKVATEVARAKTLLGNGDVDVIQFFPNIHSNIQQMVKVLQGDTKDGVVHLTDFYSFIEYVLNRSPLTDREKGYIWYLLISNNFSLIDSQPYSCIELGLYSEFYKNYDYTKQEFIEEIEEFLLQNKMESDEKNLNQVERFVKYILLTEEEKRKDKVKSYKVVRTCFSDPTEDNMDILWNSLVHLGMNLESVRLLAEYLATRNKKEKKSFSSSAYIPYHSEGLKKSTIFLTKKEERGLYHEMRELLKAVREQDSIISLEDYLDYARKAYLVDKDEYNLDLDLARLFAALEKSVSYYQFLYDKALAMKNQNIYIYGLLEDIKTYYGEIMLTSNDDDYVCGKELILDTFSELEKIVSKNYAYERVLTKKQFENSIIEVK